MYRSKQTKIVKKHEGERDRMIIKARSENKTLQHSLHRRKKNITKVHVERRACQDEITKKTKGDQDKLELWNSRGEIKLEINSLKTKREDRLYKNRLVYLKNIFEDITENKQLLPFSSNGKWYDYDILIENLIS